jgi:hypothetical protein
MQGVFCHLHKGLIRYIPCCYILINDTREGEEPPLYSSTTISSSIILRPFSMTDVVRVPI